MHLGQRDGHRQIVVEGCGKPVRPGGGNHRTHPAAHPVQEVFDTDVGVDGVAQRGLGELEHRPVVRTAQVVAQFGGPDTLQHRRHRQHIAQRLAHLLAAQGDPPVVQPVPGEPVSGGPTLRDLVLVVREDQVHPTAVNVEFGAEVGPGHRRTLQVPAWTARTPRGGPAGLTGLGAFPQGEVTRIALPGGNPLTLVHIVDAMTGQLAVVGVAEDVEVDVTAAGIGVSRVDQAPDQLDHLGDVPGGARFGRRRQHPQRVIGGGELTLVGGSPLPPGPARCGGFGENLVVNISHVAHKGDVVAAGRQPPAQNIERHAAADMADMGRRLHGGAAQINRHMTGPQRDKFTHGAGSRVV